MLIVMLKLPLLLLIAENVKKHNHVLLYKSSTITITTTITIIITYACVLMRSKESIIRNALFRCSTIDSAITCIVLQMHQ